MHGLNRFRWPQDEGILSSELRERVQSASVKSLSSQRLSSKQANYLTASARKEC